jgi:hypothetical protein
VLHSLHLASPEGGTIGQNAIFRHLATGGEGVVLWLSYGTFLPGFTVPGIDGRLQLDVALLLEPVFFGAVPITPPFAEAPVPFPNDTSLNGLAIYFQSLDIVLSPTPSGGFSNVLTVEIVVR